MKYVILIEVSDAGWPKWKHDMAAETHLNADQWFAVESMHNAYHGVQAALRMEQEAKEASNPKLRAQAASKHNLWEKAADETERLLQEEAG